ncbi:MAG: hypothetical protein ACT6UH_06995 [Hydrogenophaga sp.]|jgi:hypothetical protein|uniref:hypothetical protein n=1 Tax=unclassified Hydrogenophaga TaxID=2610897 RepID=UPI0036D3D696
MGFFSGAPEVFRRRKAEAAIQTQFELCRNMGVSLGRPATLARQVVELAFNDLPGLSDGRLQGWALTTTVLVMAFMRKESPQAMRILCAVALTRMLLAASDEGSLCALSLEEEALLQTAQELILQFNAQQRITSDL